MSSAYRLAPAVAARLVGAALVGAAVLVLLTTVLVALLSWPVLVVLVVAGLALLGVLATYVATRRIPVLRLDPAGYRVRWVHGAGTHRARWSDVQEAVTGSPAGIDCLVLRLRDGRSTSIPVAAVDHDRYALVTEVRERLTRR